MHSTNVQPDTCIVICPASSGGTPNQIMFSPLLRSNNEQMLVFAFANWQLHSLYWYSMITFNQALLPALSTLSYQFARRTFLTLAVNGVPQ